MYVIYDMYFRSVTDCSAISFQKPQPLEIPLLDNEKPAMRDAFEVSTELPIELMWGDTDSEKATIVFSPYGGPVLKMIRDSLRYQADRIQLLASESMDSNRMANTLAIDKMALQAELEVLQMAHAKLKAKRGRNLLQRIQWFIFGDNR